MELLKDEVGRQQLYVEIAALSENGMVFDCSTEKVD